MAVERNRKRIFQTWILLVLVLILVLVAVIIGWRFVDRRLDRARVENTSPLIFVRSPVQGQRFKPDNPVVVRATATGPYPILRVELYVDGQLLDVDESANEEGSESLFASFRFRVSEGVHMIHLRGVDVEGKIGQSLPVSIQAKEGPQTQSYVSILYGPESSPEGIAEEYGIDQGVLLDTNPWFEEPDRPPSGLLTIPVGEIPEEEGEEEEDEIPPIPPGGGKAAFEPGSPLTVKGSLFPTKNVTALPWTFNPPEGGPTAPIDLQAQVQDCVVKIAWSSLKDPDEFRLWMDKQDGSRLLVATLKPTAPSSERYQYEFNPGCAGLISLTVEAVNALGIQASAPVALSMDRSCASSVGEGLRFETMNVEAAPDFKQIYFYISFEGQPEERFPLDDSQFYTLVSGHGQVQPHSSVDQALTLPPLQDGILDLVGECWGWAGGDLVRIEKFAESIPEAEMQGQEIILGGSNCKLSFLLQMEDDSQSLSKYAGNMGGLPAPYDLKAEKQSLYEQYRKLSPAYDWVYRYTRVVSWRWDGNPKDITGFTIYINGKPVYKAQGGDVRETIVIFPDECGPPSTWAVVANGKGGDSPMSQVETLWQGPCTHYAKVDFETLATHRTCDGKALCAAKKLYYCDTLEVYFELSVNHITRKFYSSNFPLKMKCISFYYLPDIVTQPNGAVFLVPLFATEENYALTKNPFEIVVETEFWDQDTWSGDDSFGHYKQKHGFPDWAFAMNWFKMGFEEAVYGYGSGPPYFHCDYDYLVYIELHKADDTADTDLSYWFSLYPNHILSSPP